MLQLLSKIQPRYFIALVLGIAVVMFTSAILELRQSRAELFHILQEHSLSLSETISNNSANIVLSTDQIEQQLSERLLNNAYFIAALDSMEVLSQKKLEEIARINNIYRINIFSQSGKKIFSNHTPTHYTLTEKHSPKEMLAPILKGNQKEILFGLKEARFESGERYAVAVRRTHPSGGAIVLNLNAEQFVEFRKTIGIGKLIKDLENNSGVEYVVLQDAEGIVAATSGVTEMTSAENDSMLRLVMERDTTIMRETEFHSRTVFEVVRKLQIENESVGILRIGLSMDEVRTTDERLQRRLIVMTIVVIVLSTLIVVFLTTTKNYKLLGVKYQRAQQLTSNILEQMRDAVVTIDSNNVITIFNKQSEELFGISEEKVLGKSHNELPEELKKCFSAIFLEKETQFETTIQSLSGSEHTISVSITKTLLENGELESVTAVIKDLTEAKRFEKELQRREKIMAMGELASGVAHEIRNPLNAISMIAQRYEKEFKPKSGAKEYRELTAVLKKESARVNNIVQQFLKYARPPKIAVQKIAVKEFHNHLSLLTQQRAITKKIQFLSQCNSDAEIIIDPELMTQSLMNILFNAIEATDENGVVRFTTNVTETETQFIVEDTGAGIPKESLEKIFNLYYTTKPNGNGLGLAIAQQIIYQHNGTIEVKSEEQKGTMFTIRIPKQL